jgi:hypothetical protein
MNPFSSDFFLNDMDDPMCDHTTLDQNVITPAEARPMWDTGLVHLINAALRRAVLEGRDYAEIRAQPHSLVKARKLLKSAGWHVTLTDTWPRGLHVSIRKSVESSQ